MPADRTSPIGLSRMQFTEQNSSSLGVAIVFLRAVWQLSIFVLCAVIQPSSGNRALEAVGAAALIAVNFILVGKMDHPDWPKVQRIAAVAETGVATLLALYLLWIVPQGPAPLLLLPSLVTHAAKFEQGRTYVILTLLAASVYILAVIVNLGNPPQHLSYMPESWKRWTLLGAYGTVLLFGLVIAQLLQRQRRERGNFQVARERLQTQSQQLERINTQLNDYANRVYELAAVEERNRIAGEIHDTVAHRLTALLVQLQAARRIMKHGDTVTVEGNLLVCEELARESLEEVRTSVRAIRRTSAEEGVHSLRRLTLQYASLTNMNIHFEAASSISGLPSAILAILYRAIQEGLTNAQRHGRATQVQITLSRSGGYVQLELADNGRGQASPTLGFGLTSMRERIRQYGGELSIQSQPAQGFLLQLRLPLWEEN